jgi:hypothetical protein
VLHSVGVGATAVGCIHRFHRDVHVMRYLCAIPNVHDRRREQRTQVHSAAF